MADKESRFVIRLDSDAGQVSAEEASSLEGLRKSVSASTNAIKELGAALRSIRGSSDEAKAAKAQFRAQLDAERDKLSRNSLELAKHGRTFEQLQSFQKAQAAAKAKADAEAAKQQAALAKADKGSLDSIKAAGGPLADLISKFEGLKSVVGGSGAAFGVLAVGVTAAVTSVGLLVGAVAGAVVTFGRWAIESANVLRSQNLLREAATGTAVDAEHLGHQLDALARVVPTPRAELNALAADITRSLSGTQAGGQAIVDTFAAVAQASAALPGAGEALRGIIDRAKNFGRISISPFELQGTGLTRDDVAAQLAKRLKIGMADARLALAQGRVSLGDGAAAIRAAVEERFGKVNAAKMLDLSVLAAKFKDTLANLTSGINLDPLLGALGKFASLFDQSTVAGSALKGIVKDFGQGLADALSKAEPIAEKVFKELIIGGLKIEIAMVRTRNAINNALGGADVHVDWIKVASVYADGLADGAERIVAALGRAAVGAATLFAAVQNAKAAIGNGWADVGGKIVQGLTGGLLNPAAAVAAINAMGDALKAAFRNALGIHSPSRVFAEYGAMTAEGFAQGMESGSAGVQASADAMAPGGPRGVGAGGHTVHVGGITIIVQGGAEQAPAELTSPSFLAQLTDAVELVWRAAGGQVQAGGQP